MTRREKDRAANESGGVLAFAEYEQAIIGHILHTSDAVFPDVAQLQPEDFTQRLTGGAWIAAAGLRTAGHPIDMMSISERMVAAGEDLDEVETFLAECQQKAPTAQHAVYHAQRIQAATRHRNAKAAIAVAMEEQENGEKPLSDILRTLRDKLDGIEAEESGEPQIISAADFVAVKRPEPSQVIREVLRAGEVGILSSGAKAGKTFANLSLAVGVAAGLKWLKWQTTQGRVLYANGELGEWGLETRLTRISHAIGLPDIPADLDVWHLRNGVRGISDLVPGILRRQREAGRPYALIIIDPIFRFNGGRDEIDNTATGQTFAELATLAEQTKAAIWICHHFSKGNKSETDHMDRASGAGMFGRAPDLVMTFTKHDADDCYSVEATCRDFAEPEPFVIRRDFPLWTVEDGLDPAKLKKRSGPSTRYTVESIMGTLVDDGLRYKEWLKASRDQIGLGETKFTQLLKKAKADGLVTLNQFGTYLPAGGRK